MDIRFFLLFLVFLILKLTHVIAWSWWWVTAPLWGMFAIVVALWLLGIVLGVSCLTLAGAIEYIRNRFKK